MFKYLVIFVSPILILISFWLLFYSQINFHYGSIIAAMVLILLSGRIIAKSKFWRFKILWINLLLVYLSQAIFLLLLISSQVRYLLTFLLALAWLLIWWLMAKYFEDIDNVESSNYLAVNKFFYYLSFWFLSTSLYSLVIFLHFSLLYACIGILVASFFWSWDIIKYRDDLNWFYLLFSLFLLAQILVAVYLLPVSFYVAGTIATLWFFFIIDNTANNLRFFRHYLGLFLLVILILLITPII